MPDSASALSCHVAFADVSTMAGQPLSVAISQTLQYIQDLQQLVSTGATAQQFGQVMDCRYLT